MGVENELVFIERILRESGALILQSFGRQVQSKRKDDRSQIVTEVDVASESLIIAEIAKTYPQSSIVAEESGFMAKDVDDVWIVDPIDGTSNFVNGLPWFGVMVAHLVAGEAVSSGIFLPVSQEMYVAGRGNGAFKNGKKFLVTPQTDLSLALVGFGTDGSEKSFPLGIKGDIYKAVLPHVLNIRTTNSAVDYVYAVEGKLGGLINLENRIWDIAPVIPLAIEASCVVSDVRGEKIDLGVDTTSISRNYTLLLAQPQMHAELLHLFAKVIL